jgi:hypothetical protein
VVNLLAGANITLIKVGSNIQINSPHVGIFAYYDHPPNEALGSNAISVINWNDSAWNNGMYLVDQDGSNDAVLIQEYGTYRVEATLNLICDAATPFGNDYGIDVTMWLRKNSANIPSTQCVSFLPYLSVNSKAAGKATLDTVVTLSVGDKVNLYTTSRWGLNLNLLDENEPDWPAGYAATMTITKLA